MVIKSVLGPDLKVPDTALADLFTVAAESIHASVLILTCMTVVDLHNHKDTASKGSYFQPVYCWFIMGKYFMADILTKLMCYNFPIRKFKEVFRVWS